MLNTFSRKLCPLMSLAIAAIGCGKKISESKTTSSKQTESQEVSSVYVIKLDGSGSSLKNFFLPRPAQFEIPDKLKVRKGSTVNRVVEIAYEVNEYDSEDIQFKCSYVASPNPSEMILSKCVDYDGDEFGDISGHKFSLRLNDIIQMRFTGAQAPDLIVEAIYSMKWI
jgi:hypothetical protein